MPTTAEVFDRLKDTLVGVIGTAATATFLRRAVRRAAKKFPELGNLAITKEKLDYEYAIPKHWSDGRDGLPALVNLSGELESLLLDLTGGVMIRKLRSVPLLLDAGLFRKEES